MPMKSGQKHSSQARPHPKRGARKGHIFSDNLGLAQIWALSANPDQTDLLGQGFIHELARDNDVLGAEVLRTLGGDMDLADDAGLTALHEACIFGKTEFALFLIKAGANIHARTMAGYTPLHEAAMHGHRDIVQALLAAGAKPNVYSAGTRVSPLHLAAANGFTAIAGDLVRSGANIHARNSRHETAADMAANSGMSSTAGALRKLMAQKKLAKTSHPSRG